MNTCGTCKYKGEAISRIDYNTDDCVPVTSVTGYFLCDRAEMVAPYEHNIRAGMKMFVEDGSGYYAALCVEDDFGCNQWELK